MSKYSDRKKETISLLNKDLYKKPLADNRIKQFDELKKKYDEVNKKFKNLEKVYQFHKGIVQNISSGILTIDMQGNITFINKAALKLIGYTYPELMNKPVHIIFTDKIIADSIMTDLLEKQKMFESKEINILTSNGEIIPIGFTTTMLKIDKNQNHGIVFSFRDLRNIRNLRMQMERMDRLATLGEVSAGIAHEIRNPLAGIKTSAQVLEESFQPNDFRAQLISRIVKEIDRANDLLKKFFKFAKPGKPEPDYVDITQVIDAVYILLLSRMKKKGIKLQKHYAADLPKIFVDESQMEQLILNLLLNAIDAINEDKGVIKINVRLADYNLRNELNGYEKMILIEISDNGTGIDKENLEKIFNPFFTTKKDGVGLGLSISSRLAEENKGFIEVSSELGKGSKLSIWLPA